MSASAIIVGEAELHFHDDGPGRVLCMVIFRDSGEVREQVVDRLPTNPRWRETVARRMAKAEAEGRGGMVPYALLRGVR